MRERPILACGAMNLDAGFRIAWREAELFLGGVLPRGGEAILRDAPGTRELGRWLKAHGESLGAFPGGSASNTAAALARLGVPVALLGRVGDDGAGRFLLASSPGVDLSLVQVGGETGRCFILIDEEGERSILKVPGANDGLEIPGTVPGSFVHLHLTSLARPDGPELQAVLLERITGDTGVSLDPGHLYASRGAGSLAPLLARATHLFATRAEVALLLEGGGDAASLLVPPLRILMVKKGGEGLEVLTGDERIAVPPWGVESVDATGAGDAAAAGYLAGERAGFAPLACGVLAARCGAAAAGGLGRSGYPDARVIEALGHDFRPRAHPPLAS